MAKRRVELSDEAGEIAMSLCEATGLSKINVVVNALLLRYGGHFAANWEYKGDREAVESFLPVVTQQAAVASSPEMDFSALLEPMEV